MGATLFDVAAVADPGLVRSEEICMTLEAMLRPLDDHPSVVISAIATLLASYLLAECPDKLRLAMAESVLNDIRSKVLEADADHAA